MSDVERKEGSRGTRVGLLLEMGVRAGKVIINTSVIIAPKDPLLLFTISTQYNCS